MPSVRRQEAFKLVLLLYAAQTGLAQRVARDKPGRGLALYGMKKFWRSLA